MKRYGRRQKATNPQGEIRFTKNEQSVHPVPALMRVARGLWGSQAALRLALITGCELRTAQYWLARQRKMTDAALAALITSEHGFQFLAALMLAADARPSWWRGFKRQVELSQLRAGIEAQRRRIEELERGAA